MFVDTGGRPAPGSHMPRPHHGASPQKRAKGNPIITRYPPPPGYKGPAQVPPLQVQQQQQLGWLPGAAPAFMPGGQQQGFGGQQQQHVSPTEHFAPSFPHAQAPYPPPPTLMQNGYPPPQQQPVYASRPNVPALTISTVHDMVDVAYHPQPSPPRRHASTHSLSSLSSMTSDAAAAVVLDGNGDPLPPLDFDSISHTSLDDDDDDYDSECAFLRHPDEIDSALSIGLIEWRAPQASVFSLPATFKEAELEAIMPRPPRVVDNETVSDYYTLDRRHEQLLSVRQTAEWAQVKEDLIFREFSRFCSVLLSRAEIRTAYRCRVDHEWEETDRRFRSLTPSSAVSRSSSAVSGYDEMDLDSTHHHSRRSRQASRVRPAQSQERGNGHSRNSSITSRHRGRNKRPRPLPPVRDQAQEDVLALLGVTGSPKLVYETPGPAFGPPPSEIGGMAGAAAAAGAAGKKTHAHAHSRTASSCSASSSSASVVVTRYPVPPHVQQQQQMHQQQMHLHQQPQQQMYAGPGTFRRAASIEAWQAGHPPFPFSAAAAPPDGVPERPASAASHASSSSTSASVSSSSASVLSATARPFVAPAPIGPPPRKGMGMALAMPQIVEKERENDATPRAKYDSASRKRSFADSVAGGWDADEGDKIGAMVMAEDEDATPKPRKVLRV